MNKILIIIFSLGSSICLADENKKLTIQTLERNMILCDTQFSRSADENRYKQCAKIVFDACKPSTQEKIYFDLLGGELRGFIALMNQCDLIIGNDGGAINMAKALEKPSFIIFSPWIEKKIWATLEDGIHHISVHLNDFKPQLLASKTEKELKKKALSLYQEFEPELFKDKIELFLKQNL